MVNDTSFEINKITLSNLEEISQNQSILEEQRICEISELVNDAVAFAANMFADGYGIYEVLSLLSESVRGFINPHKETLEENYIRIKKCLQALNTHGKAVFSELFLEKLSTLNIKICEADFLPAGNGNETFTYVKNPLADEAYDVFSQQFSNPRLFYSKSFSDAVKSVSSDECEYALLPLEERGGVRLSAVAAHIYRDDLKINSVTPVFGFDGVADMKYALISKHFTVPKIEPDDDRYLEFRLRIDSSINLSEVLLAADELGFCAYRVNTINFETDDGQIPYFSLVLRGSGKDFTSLLVFLTTFSGAYTPVGVYKNLE